MPLRVCDGGRSRDLSACVSQRWTDAPAAAAVAALECREPGIYNIVDDEPAPIRTWHRRSRPSRRSISRSGSGRLLAGEAGVSMMTQIRGSSNEKAKRELCWRPPRASWRTGFAEVAANPKGAAASRDVQAAA
jgi:2-alkyl-3-oxoalkanoate reductase